jgi:Rps23 Pro-64 3,4-dihydroxylase Tpa1-like proline 4-hydroxylase
MTGDLSSSGLGTVISPKWLGQVAQLRSSFVTATPFSHVVLDDFLVESQAQAMLEEFPTIDSMPQSRDYVFGDKRELSSLEHAGPASVRYYQAMTSQDFTAFLGDLTGLPLFVDPNFHGGGFHQGGDGSFLDMHVDFNIHPMHGNWQRMLNILLYLCPDWKPEFGGDLQIKSRVEEEPTSIALGFNRAVIMLTADNTYHGFRKMHPPTGVTRKSIATYAYQIVSNPDVIAHTTRWVPDNAGVTKRILARHFDTLVRIKQRAFTSRTARNR